MEIEGEKDVHIFCFEDNGHFTTDIVWNDPQGNSYIPGSPTEGANSRIEARGSRLSLYDLKRSDSGSYRCSRTGNLTDSVDFSLFVYGKQLSDNVHVLCTLCVVEYWRPE